MTDMTSRTLPEGTILSGRYLLGAVRKSSDAGIAYTAFDRKLRIPAEVYEYYPTDCALRQQNGGIAAKPGMETVYRDKCRRLRDKGNLCLHQPESDVYDVLSINGTLYFIHAVSSEKAADFYAYGAETEENPAASAPAANPHDAASELPAEPEDDEKTRTVRGLFLHTDPADDSPATAEPHDVPLPPYSAAAPDAPEDAPTEADTFSPREDTAPAANTVEIPVRAADKPNAGKGAAPQLSPEDSVAVLLRDKGASQKKSAGGTKAAAAPKTATRHETATKETVPAP